MTTFCIAFYESYLSTDYRIKRGPHFFCLLSSYWVNLLYRQLESLVVFTVVLFGSFPLSPVSWDNDNGSLSRGLSALCLPGTCSPILAGEKGGGGEWTQIIQHQKVWYSSLPSFDGVERNKCNLTLQIQLPAFVSIQYFPPCRIYSNSEESVATFTCIVQRMGRYVVQMHDDWKGTVFQDCKGILKK